MLFQRRMLRELVRNAVTTLLLLTAVLVLGSCAQILRHPEGLTLFTVLRALPYFAAVQVDVTLPLAVLVAVVLTYGRAAADNEIDALRTSGVHPLQIGLPGLLFGALVSLPLLAAMDYGQPWAEVAKRRLADDVDYATLLRNKLSAGEPVKLDQRTIISAEGFNEAGQALNVRVQIYDSNGEIEREILADRADVAVQPARGELTLVLLDFRTVRGPRADGKSMSVTRPLGKGAGELDTRHLTTPQLLAILRRGAPSMGFTPSQVELAVHMRAAAALACLLFALLGMPLALLFRRGDRTGAFLIAFLVALFVYFPSREVSIYFAEKQLLSPQVAAFSGSALLLAVGLLLCRRVLLR
jgi:lipopolysaccharide export system permease protein